MVLNNKKLRELEDNVLPDFPEEALIHITDDKEILLFDKASEIRDRLYPEVKALMDNEKLTFDERLKTAQQIYSDLTPYETAILTKDFEFCVLRLKDLILKFFEPQFPKASRDTVNLRILWFFREMDKLFISESITDSEFRLNRDEDSPDFDDFKWWERVDNKIKTDFPEGIFTEESYKQLEEETDRRYSEHIKQYWIDHPEEKEAFFEALEKRLKENKK